MIHGKPRGMDCIKLLHALRVYSHFVHTLGFGHACPSPESGVPRIVSDPCPVAGAYARSMVLSSFALESQRCWVMYQLSRSIYSGL